MTPEKMLFVLNAYDSYLSELGFESIEDNDASSPGGRVSHARWMCGRAAEFIAEERIEKADRWLGFIQGVLWCSYLFSIGEMREHNRE
jgi:hypothetical protein